LAGLLGNLFADWQAMSSPAAGGDTLVIDASRLPLPASTFNRASRGIPIAVRRRSISAGIEIVWPVAISRFNW